MLEWFRKFTHDRLGWGYPSKRVGFDGCSATTVCALCHGRLLMDSQGNWFHLDAYRTGGRDA